MVAGILEKSKRVRNPLLFDIRTLPNFHAQQLGCDKTADVRARQPRRGTVKNR
jgi:hypothetical protein